MKATDTLTFLDGLGNHHPQRWYAELANFASRGGRLKRGLILMRKSNASETVLGRQKRPNPDLAGLVC